MRIATLGAALSGNKGAASMIEALVEGMAADETTIVVLTTYPRDDAALASPGVEVVPLGPKRLIAVELPIALAARLLPHRWREKVSARAPALRALREVDVVADISGVAFADHRGWKFHIYNALLTALPIAAGVPVVKCSQALGPFEHRLNRLLAKRLLPRVDRVLARGEISYENAAALGVPDDHLGRATDLAFTLTHDEPLGDALRATVDSLAAAEGVVVVMPSAVVEGWCDRNDIDHAAALADIVERTCDELGVGVLLVPHAYRATGKPRRMDDGRVCRSIAARLGHRSDVVLVDVDLPPAQLRALVAQADLLVTSRFHGMVTGLAASTPTVVIGWGHKYEEVLSQFDAGEYVLDRRALGDPATVATVVGDAWTRRGEYGAALQRGLDPVVRSARDNFAALRSVAGHHH